MKPLLLAAPLLLLAGCGASSGTNDPETLTRNGKPLSAEEQRAAMKETAAMIKGAKPGDPNSIDTSGQPKTEFARRYKRLLEQGKEAESRYAAVMEIGVEGTLGEAQLGTASGRSRSLGTLARMSAATDKYVKSIHATLAEASELGKSMGQPPHDYSVQLGETDAVAAGTQATIAAALAIVRHADTAGAWTEGGTLRFATPAANAGHKALLATYDAKVDALTKSQETIMARRQAAMAAIRAKIKE